MIYHSITYGKDKSFENTEGIIKVEILSIHILCQCQKTCRIVSDGNGLFDGETVYVGVVIKHYHVGK